MDFLFVVDNSESMERHQNNLRASFEPFIEGIYETLDDLDDFHVGVVTSDAYRANADGCQEIGALVTSVDAGGREQTQECGPFAEGNRFMTDEDDLSETFSCAAAVGVEGSPSESPMKAMKRAISGENFPWYSSCNRGFIRDNALLMAVIITDEADGESQDWSDQDETPDRWFRAVEETKGVESNAVVLSLINGVTPECPIVDPAFDGTKIADFTNRFTHGFVGGVCEADYGQLFARAVNEVDDACDAWTEQLQQQ